MYSVFLPDSGSLLEAQCAKKLSSTHPSSAFLKKLQHFQLLCIHYSFLPALGIYFSSATGPILLALRTMTTPQYITHVFTLIPNIFM